MKRFWFVVVLLLTLGLRLDAQSPKVGPTQLTSDTCPGSGCVVLPVSGLGGVAVQITGTYSATANFEVSVNGTTFVALNLTPPNSSTAASTTTSTGVWTGGVGGGAVVRVRLSSFVSGTATVTIQAAPTSARGPGGNGGGAAPSDATYITQTANATLTNEQALGALSSGILRAATTTGVVTSLGDNLPPVNGGVGGQATVTTTGNIVQLASTSSLVLMNNASLATIQGIAAGVAGQEITILATNARVDMPHQNSSAAAEDRLINIATTAPSSMLSGGYVKFKYDLTAGRWRMVDHDQGNWISPTFSAGNYTASGTMTWTVESGDVFAQGYYLKGRILYVNFNLGTTTVGGSLSNQLRLSNALWGGFTMQRVSQQTVPFLSDNGTAQGALSYEGDVGLTSLAIVKITAANYSAATNATATFGTLTVFVQ